jgi:hypothetical protein
MQTGRIVLNVILKKYVRLHSHGPGQGLVAGSVNTAVKRPVPRKAGKYLTV